MQCEETKKCDCIDKYKEEIEKSTLPGRLKTAMKKLVDKKAKNGHCSKETINYLRNLIYIKTGRWI